MDLRQKLSYLLHFAKVGTLVLHFYPSARNEHFYPFFSFRTVRIKSSDMLYKELIYPLWELTGKKSCSYGL